MAFEKIAKNGPIYRRLSSHGIKTVKDLLQLYITDQSSLREKIGNIASKSWDAIIEHAKACVIDDGKRYIYRYGVAEQSIALVFNCIYEVVEVSFNGQNYLSPESLNSEKYLVERGKQHAYKNLKDLIPYETPTHGLVKTLAGVQAKQWVAPDQGLQQFDLPVAQQGQQEMWPYLCQRSTSTPQIGESTHNGQVGAGQLPELGEMLLGDGNGWPVCGSSQIQSASYFSPSTSWEQAIPVYLHWGDGVEIINDSSYPNSGVVISSKGKRKTVWHKIRSALKWVIPHAAKRKANVFLYHY